MTVWSMALLLFGVGALRNGTMVGDGKEYLAYAYAFASHLSPDIRQEDLERLATSIPKNNTGFLHSLPTLGLGKPFGDGGQTDRWMFARTADGHLYTHHFWLYSALVAPFLLLTNWMGLNAFRAFPLANLAFVFVSLGYLAFFWRGTAFQKQTLAALFLLTGTTYYIWWPTPEIFTASCLLLALMAVYDRRYVLALLMTALPATQNPPLLGFLIVLAAMYALQRGLIGVVGGKFRCRIAGNLRVFLVSGVAFGIALLPLAFFYLTFGVLNPLVAMGAGNPALLSWRRLFSLYFDLNQGMIVALMGVFIGIAFVAVLLVGKGLEHGNNLISILYSFRPLAAGVAVSVLMAIPALTTGNWNSGHAVFMRYAYWLSVPILFGFIVSLSALPRQWRIMLAIATVFAQFVGVMYYDIWGKNWRSNWLEFKPVAKRVMIHFPSLYNPEPEIFLERLIHRDAILGESGYHDRVFSYPSADAPRKVLVPTSRFRETLNDLQSKCETVRVASVAGNWMYLNVLGKCSVRR